MCEKKRLTCALRFSTCWGPQPGWYQWCGPLVRAAPRDPSARYTAGEHIVPISLLGLPSGTYYLRVSLGTGEVRTMKLMNE